MTIVVLAIVTAIGSPVIVPMAIVAFITAVTTGAFVTIRAVPAAATTAK